MKAKRSLGSVRVRVAPFPLMSLAAWRRAMIEVKMERDLTRFVTGGNATFTLQGKQSRYTYKVRKSEGEKPLLFVSLLTAPDEYTYLGILGEASLRMTKASKLNETSAPVKAFNWFWNRETMSAPLPGLEFFHAGKCCRCGRELTVPESIERGIGPECWEKMK
jgi:hypothetical protein